MYMNEDLNDEYRYINEADLAEDFGIYDPEEHGYVYFEGRGWKKEPVKYETIEAVR